MKINLPGLFKKESKEESRKIEDIKIANTHMYRAEISRKNPSCFFLLIDQSGSMADPFGGEPGQSKSERLADAINRVLSELVISCTGTIGDAKNRFDIGVIGYGERVGPALRGPLSGRDIIPISEVANKPARVETRLKKTEDGVGGTVDVSVKFAIWFDPVAQNGTPMCEALRQARSIIEPWTQKHPDSFPPIVINITDGEATDGDPRQPAEELQKLATIDGNLLLFNLHLSSRAGMPIPYPEGDSGLPDEYARQLFQMSSIIPPSMQELAKKGGNAIGPKSRGFVFNADILEVIKFLDIGTKVLR